MVAKKRTTPCNKRSPTTHRTCAQIKAQTDGYNKTPAEKKKRAQRMKARRAAEKDGKVSKGDGKEVDHKKMLSKGGSNAKSNQRIVARSKNRAHGTSPGGSAPSKYSKKKKSKPTKRKK